jgi:hypothetical protein
MDAHRYNLVRFVAKNAAVFYERPVSRVIGISEKCANDPEFLISIVERKANLNPM